MQGLLKTGIWTLSHPCVVLHLTALICISRQSVINLVHDSVFSIFSFI